jgi:hypothetical protein
MSKKNIIILVCVVAVCAIGLLASCLFSWPVNEDSTSGNIGKSSRFSRKTATERIDNMEELLRADEDYRNSILLAYSVMQARAIQFGNLVDMSNQAAGEIPEFESVLQEMNEAAPLFTNVANALVEAGNNLNTVMAGMPCPDVTQSTINASLSYTTLQKQNYLANRFIDTTDKYVKKAEATEELMLVRDLWLNYQQMTASLEGDKKAAKALDKKAALLTPDQALKAIKEFGIVNQAGIITSEDMLGGLVPESIFVARLRDMEITPDILGEITQTPDLLGESVPNPKHPYYRGRIVYFDEGVNNLIQGYVNLPAINNGDVFEALTLEKQPKIIQLLEDVNDVIYETAEGNVERLDFRVIR